MSGNKSITQKEAIDLMRKKYVAERMFLEPRITPEAVELATADIAINIAPGTGMVADGVYKSRPAMLGRLARFFSSMIHLAHLRLQARQFYVAPLDTPGKGPGLRANKRPVALFRPITKLRDLIILRRILAMVGIELSPDQYANQRNRSTATRRSDLDLFVGKSRERGKHVCIAGLDIARSLDGASYLKLTQALSNVGAPRVLVRFIGARLTTRQFRFRRGAAPGTVLGRGFCPTRGVPQGGVISPLL